MNAKQSRGRATRDNIVKAALTLLGEVGAAELDHRALARIAGVALGRTTYHFSSREEIVLAAYRRLEELDAARFAVEVGGNNVLGATRDSVLTDAVRVLEVDLGPERGNTLAYLELALEARRDPKAHALFGELFTHRVRYFEDLFACASYPDAAERARIFMSCYIGTLLHLVSSKVEAPSTSVLRHRLDICLTIAEEVRIELTDS